MAPWCAEMLKFNLKSNIALPLKDRSGVFGALARYAGEPDAFGPEEISLLMQMADNLALELALDAIVPGAKPPLARCRKP